jgi:hypothetical protein
MTEQQQAQESREETRGQAQEATESAEAAGEGSELQERGRGSQDASEQTREGQGSQEEPEGEEDDGQEPRTYDQDYVTNLRNEAAGYRVRAQAAETRVQELEDARGTADEQLRTENEQLRSDNATLLDRVRRSSFIEAVNLPNARVAWGVLEDAGIAVEYDENHRPTNLADVRRSLKREFPHLFGEGSADGGATTRKKDGYAGRPGVDRIAYAYENDST